MLTLQESAKAVCNDRRRVGVGRATGEEAGAVLIIEDHSMILHALQGSLRRLCPGVEHFCVRSAYAALEVIGRRWFWVFVDPDAPGVDESSLVHELGRLGLAPRCSLITAGKRDAATAYRRGLEWLTCLSTRVPMHEFDAILARTVLGKEVPVDGCRDDTLPSFSRRHVDVLRLLQRGLPNKLIAFELGITEPTVRNHMHELMKRLGVRNRVQAAQAAARFGIA